MHLLRNGLYIVYGAEDITRVRASYEPCPVREQWAKVLCVENGVVSARRGRPPLNDKIMKLGNTKPARYICPMIDGGDDDFSISRKLKSKGEIRE